MIMRKVNTSMRLFRKLIRNIRDAFKSVFRNLSLSMASILCIAITLIVVSIAMVATVNVNNFTKKIESDVTIVVFLDRDISLERFKEIEKEIKQIDNVGTKDKDVVGKDKMTVRDELM